MPGGDLVVALKGSGARLTGPAEEICHGTATLGIHDRDRAG
jgi:hypothetical protein